MKKLSMIAVMMCLITNVVYSQWTYKTVKSEFDGSFKKAYTNTDNYGFLMMEVGEPNYDGDTLIQRPFLALGGSYFCDDTAYIDFVFIVDGVNKKYEIIGSKSSDSTMYYFNESIWTNEFIADFKNASKCFVRVNQDYCKKDYYQFVFSGSSASYNFIIK
jgi:hypothetical protein